MGGFTKLGVPFPGGPYKKDCSMIGSILGSPRHLLQWTS